MNLREINDSGRICERSWRKKTEGDIFYFQRKLCKECKHEFLFFGGGGCCCFLRWDILITYILGKFSKTYPRGLGEWPDNHHVWWRQKRKTSVKAMLNWIGSFQTTTWGSRPIQDYFINPRGKDPVRSLNILMDKAGTRVFLKPVQ